MGLKSFFKKIFGHGGEKGGSKKGQFIIPPPNGYPDGYTGGGNQEYYDLAKKKCENDDPVGWRMLAVCYENGWVVEKNPTEAERCRERARNLDNSTTVQTPNPNQKPVSNPKPEKSENIIQDSDSLPESGLGYHYYELARKKINNGDPLGWRMLAECYKNGWMLKKDPDEAKKCRETAQHLENYIRVKTPNPRPKPVSNSKPASNSKPIPTPEPEVLELEHSPFNISMVAPSGFGKTTLLVTIMNSAENKMNNPKKGLSIACEDEDDQRRLKEAHNKLNNDIMACVDNHTAKVEPTLPGTGEPKKFNFYFQQSEEEASFRHPFSIMDIPGGWINPNNRITDEMNIKWEDFKEHLHVSRLLFVPIDATLIMECNTEKEKCAAVKILDNSSTSELIKEWARYRKGEFDETGKTSALFFVPVKCETYRNKAQNLEEKVKQYFANTASQVHSICPDIQQYYIPLETLGCVELSMAKWETEEGKEAFYPSFRKMKESAFLQPKNVEVLFSMMYHMATQEMETTINKFDPADKKEFQEIIEPFMKELKSNGDISEIEKHRINWW